MKTITELNTKWWYRLLKVGHTISFFIILIGSLTGIFFAYEPTYDNEKSYIKCVNGKEFILSENGISLYSDYMSFYDNEKAENLCARDQKIQLEKFLLEREGVKITPEIAKAELARRKEAKYELISKFTDRDWLATIGFSFLLILAILFIFETMRRIFYYILLGSLFPKL